MEQLLANQDATDRSQNKVLKEKDSKIATMNLTLHQQESEILTLENRYEAEQYVSLRTAIIPTDFACKGQLKEGNLLKGLPF